MKADYFNRKISLTDVKNTRCGIEEISRGINPYSSIYLKHFQ